MYRAPQDTHVHVALRIGRVPARVCGVEEMAETFVDVDARVLGSDASRYEFREARARGAEVTELFISSTGEHAHFQLATRMPATEMQSEVHVEFTSTLADSTLVGVSPLWIHADGTLGITSGALTSRGGIYSGPALHVGEILFGSDPFVHVGVSTCDPSRRQGSPERAVFRRVAFRTWLDARAGGEVDAAPVASVAAGTVDVQYAIGSGAREARLVYDPRDARGRLVPGRHPIRIRWRVRQKAARLLASGVVIDFEEEIHVLVADDGSITVGA